MRSNSRASSAISSLPLVSIGAVKSPAAIRSAAFSSMRRRRVSPYAAA